MFGRGIKSALLIDFENVGQFCPPEHLANWMAWLEDGCFDSGRRRRIVERRVYWNATGLIHEDTFKRQRFETILCERYNRLKNGLDIRIAFDAAELIFHERPSLQEVIILAMDSDYVQVLKQLRKMGKRTVVLVNERSTFAHTAFSHHADILIPVHKFTKAIDYQPRTLADKALGQWRRATSTLSRKRNSAAAKSTQPSPATPVPSTPTPATTASDAAPPPAVAVPITYVGEIDAVVAAVLVATQRMPNNYVSRTSIDNELAKIQGFEKRGPKAYFGANGYIDLMQQVASRDPHIKLFNPMPKLDSVSVRYASETKTKEQPKVRTKIRPLLPGN